MGEGSHTKLSSILYNIIEERTPGVYYTRIIIIMFDVDIVSAIVCYEHSVNTIILCVIIIIYI